MNTKTIDIKVKSEMYHVTTCVVDLERYKQGKRIFPCGDGCDHKLTATQCNAIDNQLKNEIKGV